MVRSAVSTAILLSTAVGTPTVAFAGPDWRGAGGAIFAGSAPDAEPSAASPSAASIVPTPAQPYAREIEAAAAQHGIDPKLLHALVVVESRYRADALSPAGAGGLTQLMPSTARVLGVADRFDAAASLLGGADYLARQIARFGDLRLALAAYNSGPERVARLGRVPSIPETQAYVSQVLSCYLALAAGRAVRSPRDCPGVTP